MNLALRQAVSPLVDFARWYERTARRYPFTVGLITSGIKTTVADIFAQKVSFFVCDLEYESFRICLAGHARGVYYLVMYLAAYIHDVQLILLNFCKKKISP